MARQIKPGVEEEIQSVQHNYPRDGHDGSIRCIIGQGVTGANSVFAYAVPQTFEEIIIDGARYETIMQSTPQFNRDDLWPAIDSIRGAA